MMGFARSWAQASSTFASASARDAATTFRVMCLPTRTSPISGNPMCFMEFETAFPWGSRSAGSGMTSISAVNSMALSECRDGPFKCVQRTDRPCSNLRTNITLPSPRPLPTTVAFLPQCPPSQPPAQLPSPRATAAESGPMPRPCPTLWNLATACGRPWSAEPPSLQAPTPQTPLPAEPRPPASPTLPSTKPHLPELEARWTPDAQRPTCLHPHWTALTGTPPPRPSFLLPHPETAALPEGLLAQGTTPPPRAPRPTSPHPQGCPTAPRAVLQPPTRAPALHLPRHTAARTPKPTATVPRTPPRPPPPAQRHRTAGSPGWMHWESTTGSNAWAEGSSRTRTCMKTGMNCRNRLEIPYICTPAVRWPSG